MEKENKDIVDITYKRIKPLEAYFKEHGTIKDIKQYDVMQWCGEKVNIGNLISNLRKNRSKNQLSDDVIEILDYMGMKWDGNNHFDEYKKYLTAWYFKHKTLSNLTQNSTLEYGDEVINVGAMLLNLRLAKKNKTLTKAQIEYLDMLDISWAPRDMQVAYAPLVKYSKMYGKESLASIKMDTVFEDGENTYNVGKQVNHLRTRYNKGLLTEEEIGFFEDLGMNWGRGVKTRPQIKNTIEVFGENDSLVRDDCYEVEL